MVIFLSFIPLFNTTICKGVDQITVNTFTISGRTEPCVNIYIYDNGKYQVETVSDMNGNYSSTLNLEKGMHNITLTIKDDAGNYQNIPYTTVEVVEPKSETPSAEEETKKQETEAVERNETSNSFSDGTNEETEIATKNEVATSNSTNKNTVEKKKNKVSSAFFKAIPGVDAYLSPAGLNSRSKNSSSIFYKSWKTIPLISAILILFVIISLIKKNLRSYFIKYIETGKKRIICISNNSPYLLENISLSLRDNFNSVHSYLINNDEVGQGVNNEIVRKIPYLKKREKRLFQLNHPLNRTNKGLRTWKMGLVKEIIPKKETVYYLTDSHQNPLNKEIRVTWERMIRA